MSLAHLLTIFSPALLALQDEAPPPLPLETVVEGEIDEGHQSLQAEHLHDGEISGVGRDAHPDVVGLGSVCEESDEAAPLGDETGLEEPAGCRIELPGQSYVPIRKRESIS